MENVNLPFLLSIINTGAFINCKIKFIRASVTARVTSHINMPFVHLETFSIL